MTPEIKSFFESENIEYFSVIPYECCKEINPAIIMRETFTPKSVIIFLLPYYTGETVNISRYAASLDYHLIIKDVTSRLIEGLREKYKSASFRGYGDHSPIDEGHAAVISGLGVFGENRLLINEKYGTYVFIADVITDIEPHELSAISPKAISFCEGCGACKAACPTGILRGEGEDCLSAITQRKGELSEGEISLMRQYNTVWGCDECQRHCPHNATPRLTPISFFYEERIDALTSEILSSMSDVEFMRRAFSWRKRKTVERNLDALGY